MRAPTTHTAPVSLRQPSRPPLSAIWTYDDLLGLLWAGTSRGSDLGDCDDHVGGLRRHLPDVGGRDAGRHLRAALRLVPLGVPHRLGVHDPLDGALVGQLNIMMANHNMADELRAELRCFFILARALIKPH